MSQSGKKANCIIEMRFLKQQHFVLCQAVLEGKAAASTYKNTGNPNHYG
jgi:hypothetical protein